MKNPMGRPLLWPLFVALGACGSYGPEPVSVSQERPDTAGMAADLFRDSLGLDINAPAVASNYLGGWTATAYVADTLYRVYFEASGGADIHAAYQPRRPAGTVRTVSLFIDHGNTNIADRWPAGWAAEQQRHNEDIERHSRAIGLSEPIARFENTNLLVDGGLLDPRSRESVVDYLATQGVLEGDWDLIVVANIDRSPEGGWASGDMAYMGCNQGSDCRDLDVTAQGSSGFTPLQGIGQALYDHEIGHLWGWEHEWSSSSDTTLPELGLITEPALFGWTDTDGDGIVEILDSTPYGLPGRD